MQNLIRDALNWEKKKKEGESQFCASIRKTIYEEYLILVSMDSFLCLPSNLLALFLSLYLSRKCVRWFDVLNLRHSEIITV